MATFRPVSRNINETPTSSQEYLAMIDELNKLRRPTDVAQGFGTDRTTPNAYALQGKGVSQVLPGSQVTQTPVTPSSQVSTAYQTQVPQDQPAQPAQPAQSARDRNKPQSVKVIENIINASQPQEVSKDQNGRTYYSDGTVKDTSGLVTDQQGNFVRQDPEIIQVLSNGYLLSRDGTVFKNIKDTFNPDLSRGQNFEQMILGNQDATITQGYGNYNPSLGYAGGTHSGLDIAGQGQWNVPISLPFGAEVVQRYTSQYPTARLGDFSEANGFGYGNSVLVRLPTGEMFRFSHLKNSNLREGDTIQPGQVIGITGNTGNSTAEHLDTEYYNANGQKQDPLSFVPDSKSYPVKAQTEASLNELSPQDRQLSLKMKLDNNKLSDQDRQQYANEISQIEQEVNQSKLDFQNKLAEKNKNDALYSAISNPNASDLIAGVGAATQAPAVGLSELAKGDVLGARQELSNTLANATQNAGIKTDIGITEALGGNWKGAKDKALALFQNALNNPQETLQNAGQDITKLANEGLNIKSGIESITNPAMGLVNNTANIFNDARSIAQKTLQEGVQGIVPKAYAKTNNPLQELGGKPVGQTGSSGEALTSSMAPSNQPITPQNVSTQSRASNSQNNPISQGNTFTSSNKSVSSGSSSSSSSNKSSSSSNKSSSSSSSSSSNKSTSTAKASTPTKTTTTQSKAPTQTKSITQQNKNPYSPTKTTYGVQTQTKSQAPAKAPTPAPKQSVFKKVVSKITSFFKKK